ncbi:MAG TPA: flagellar assembly peptidoglycan hydrolase FlgJ [Xanthobacteraceae bacterium]|jgi:Rod binding domain-containing protein|nr:flagellar assembly peptidoglycan hydrolase FlgJ [Xanthobacteraceae bacterium]
MSALPTFALPSLAAPAAAAFARGTSINSAAGGSSHAASAPNSKARTAAVNFEAQFLNAMFSQMETGIDGDGPFGGGPAVGVWRSFLTDQYARSFAQAGGIGIADKVYHALLAQQEAPAAVASNANAGSSRQ